MGQSCGRPTIARLVAHGFGECTLPEELPPRREPWFYDCGAFRLHLRGKKFRARPFLRGLRAIERGEISRPSFIVAPDLVAAGLASLERSRRWIPRCAKVAPVYLAVQDGMVPADVEPLLPQLAGIFVGGSLPWKIRTGGEWAQFARERGVGCHIGRCGGINRVKWARRIGATSIDSALPLYSQENLARFVRALNCRQQELLP